MARQINPPPPEPTTPDNPDMAWAVNESQVDLAKLMSAGPQQHDLYQEGPFIKCRTAGHVHGHHIGVGKQLVRLNSGAFKIIDEKIVTPSGRLAKFQWRHLRRR